MGFLRELNSHGSTRGILARDLRHMQSFTTLAGFERAGRNDGERHSACARLFLAEV
jgi:hypothetical protein